MPTEMVTKVLCVAEKPSIAKAVAGHLSGGSARVVSHLSLPPVFLGQKLIDIPEQFAYPMAEKLPVSL